MPGCFRSCAGNRSPPLCGGWVVVARRRCGVDCQRILIGGRLLIYVVPAALAGDPVALAPRLLAAGVAERDREGFNRFRLVLLGRVEPDAALALRRVCRGRVGADARAHLHLIGG